MRGGVGLIILAVSLTPCLDAVAKIMGTEHSPLFICFARYLSAGLVALALAFATGERVTFRLADLPIQLIRTALMMGAMTAFISALALVPLADAVGGFLIAPIVSTILCVVCLGERLNRDKLIGAGLSLLGAVVITQPGLGMATGTLMALGGGVLLGCYFAASRGGAQSGGAIAALAQQSLLGSGMVAPLALSDGLPAISGQFLLCCLVLGVLSALTHMLTILAFRRAEATVLAPFMHFNLIVTVLVGFFFFGEVPEATTFFGLAAILAGGLVTAAGLSALWPGPLATFIRPVALHAVPVRKDSATLA